MIQTWLAAAGLGHSRKQSFFAKKDQKTFVPVGCFGAPIYWAASGGQGF